MSKLKLSIGDTVWCISPSNGVAEVLTVEDSTSRSYILSDGQKIPKNHDKPSLWVQPNFGGGSLYCFSREEAVKAKALRMAYELSSEVRKCQDVDKLMAVAKIFDIEVGVD
ncbi:hypothetical protein [Myxococcus phage Mx1]|nr:hypothetical protein [Myxococcus phage Mx1]